MKIKKNISENMLSVEEISSLFKIPSVTLQRWVYQGKIPCKLVNDKYYFKKSVVFKWAKMHNFEINEQINIRGNTDEFNSLTDMIKGGGVYFDIKGNDIYRTFENSLQRLDFFNQDEKKEILNELLNREEIASTSLGNGIAIPHLRNRFNLKLENNKIPVFFLENEINFNSIDGVPVFVYFMMFTNSASVHLKMLSKISYILHNNSFLKSLRNINKDKFLEEINRLEREMLK